MVCTYRMNSRYEPRRIEQVKKIQEAEEAKKVQEAPETTKEAEQTPGDSDSRDRESKTQNNNSSANEGWLFFTPVLPFIINLVL